MMRSRTLGVLVGYLVSPIIMDETRIEPFLSFVTLLRKEAFPVVVDDLIDEIHAFLAVLG